MVDWLRDDLMACSSDWIIAYMHQGPYSKGSHNSDTELNLFLTRNHIIPLLESYGVDLVLCGHSHSYERSSLINGHYGVSSTWNATTMRKWPGNGSDLGGVDASGIFITGPSAAGGVYQKPLPPPGRARSMPFRVRASSVQLWDGGSTAFVNPNPHPVHLVNLLAIGSMVIDVEGHRLNGTIPRSVWCRHGRFHDPEGSDLHVHPAAPTIEGNLPRNRISRHAHRFHRLCRAGSGGGGIDFGKWHSTGTRTRGIRRRPGKHLGEILSTLRQFIHPF